MAHTPEMASSTINIDRRAQAWAYVMISLAILEAYGVVWARGIQGDDLCMCELAATKKYFLKSFSA